MAMEQGMPPEATGGEQGGEDQVSQLIGNVGDGLAMLTDVLGSVSPDLGAKLGGLSDQVKAVLEEAMAMASGGASPKGPKSAGVAAPEVGGAKAMAASPAGIPRG